MKDRIKQLMESQHMTQQVFAEFLGMAPATLSGIFNDRTRPTLNVVEAIKKKFPDISTDWLMFGKEPMYTPSPITSEGSESSATHPSGAPVSGVSVGRSVQESMLDFGQQPTPTPHYASQQAFNHNGVRSTHQEIVREELKFIDKPQRRVTEIRVYYDDQTWESFVPSKK